MLTGQGLLVMLAGFIESNTGLGSVKMNVYATVSEKSAIVQQNIADPAGFFEAAGVGLSDGRDFGLPGWVRLNFGCPLDTLERALARMQAACSAARP